MSPLISIKAEQRTHNYIFSQNAWSVPMTTLSNFHNNDTSKDGAFERATLVLGALTVLAVIVIMVFAST